VPVPAPVFMPADEAPTESLVAGTMGDRCVNCGAPLSSDQRYCINCGERRGAARFTLPAATAASAEPASSPSRPPRSRRPRPSQGATLVAGIGTLLLAMGVGVLIGHGSSGTKTVSSPRAQVITVNAGGGGVSSAPTSTTSTSQSSASAKHSKKSGGGSSQGKASHKAKHTASTTPKATKQEAAAAQSAANKVTGGSDVNNAPVTVTSGQSCSGQGCQGGKFTGNFFGGGG
jgi:zinc ribbon protein